MTHPITDRLNKEASNLRKYVGALQSESGIRRVPLDCLADRLLDLATESRDLELSTPLTDDDEIPVEGLGQFMRRYKRDAVVLLAFTKSEDGAVLAQIVTYGATPNTKDYACAVREHIEPKLREVIGADGPAFRVEDRRAENAVADLFTREQMVEYTLAFATWMRDESDAPVCDCLGLCEHDIGIFDEWQAQQNAALNNDAQKWRLDYSCCGREDGFQIFNTHEEAEEHRESYTTGHAVHPSGYSAKEHEPGHRRCAIISREQSAEGESDGR